ncbi:MAG: hypothetical protein ACXVB6_16805, partial [Mucilaginibacter sp.]
VKIHLNEASSKASSWYSAAVSCLSDTVVLNDYAGINEVHVLKRKFLEIVYDTRGGSGSQFRNTIILSVIRNKINVSLLVTSFGKAFGGDIDGSLYTLKFNITGNDKSNFKLIAHSYDRQKSSLHPKKDYIKNRQVILNFDPNQNIFYSTHKKITQYFTTECSDGQSKKLEINDSLPVINFDKSTYYYIKGGWYEKENSDTLFRGYYR